MNKLLSIIILSLSVVIIFSAKSDPDLCQEKDGTSKAACNQVTKALVTNETHHCCWMEIQDKTEGYCQYLVPSNYSKVWSEYEQLYNTKVNSIDCSANFLYLSYLALIFVLFI